MNRTIAAIIVVSCLTGVTRAETPAAVTTGFGAECQQVLISRLRAARKEIKVAIYEFTKKDIADALIERANGGVKVTVKIDAKEAEYQYTVDLLSRLAQAKVAIIHIQMPAGVKMHDKFAVIDGRFVVTGSYNWTKRATEANWENVVAIDSAEIAKQYLVEWEQIKSVP